MIGFVGVTTAANTSTSGSSVTVDTPAGIQPGDLLVAQFSSRDFQATTSGWTRLLYVPPNHSLHVRTVEASEPSSHTFSLDFDSSGRLAVGVTAWRGVDAVDVAAAGDLLTANGTTVTAPTVDGSDGRLLRAWASSAAVGAGEVIPPAGEGLTQRYAITNSLTGRRVVTFADADFGGGTSGTSVGTTPSGVEVRDRSGLTVVLRPDSTPLPPAVAASVEVQVAVAGVLSVPAVHDPSSLDVTVEGDTAALTWPPPSFPDATAVDVFRRGPYGTEGEVDDSPFDPTVDAPIGRVPIGQTTFDDGPLSSGFYVWQVFPVRPQTSDGTVTANVEEYV
jgi:hypothetical protein